MATVPLQSTAIVPLQSTTTVPLHSTATVPLHSTATVPHKSIATVPQQSMATVPLQSTTTLPLQSIATVPLQSMTTVPHQSIATVPLQSIATVSEHKSCVNVEVAVLDEVLLYVHRNHRIIRDGHLDFHTAPELSSTSSLGLPISNSPYGLCRRTATFEEEGYSTRQRPTIHP